MDRTVTLIGISRLPIGTIPPPGVKGMSALTNQQLTPNRSPGMFASVAALVEIGHVDHKMVVQRIVLLSAGIKIAAGFPTALPIVFI